MERNKNKIIFFMPSIDGGGVEKNLFIISNYIRKKINNVSIITFDKKFKKFFDDKIEIISADNIENNKNYSKYYKYLKCINLLMKEYYKNKNILVIAFQANIYAVILAFFFNFKIICRSNSSPTGWSHNIFKKFVFKFFYKYADEIIVNSKDFQNEFKRRFNLNTSCIYNPLDKNRIVNLSKKKIKFDFFNNKKYLNIINIARFTDQKDHLTLLKCFKNLNNKIKSKLVIIGYGQNKSKMEYFVKENKLVKNVKILDFKKNPYPYIKKSDLFILTSKYEGLPNVLLEAQVLKKFIISSDCPTGPKEILLNGKIGDLFNIGDYKELEKKILFFSKYKKNFSYKINLAYKNLHRFDLENNCEKYWKLISKYI